MAEKEQAADHFINILNIVYDNKKVREDFKRKYISWCTVFSSEWKLFNSMKLQSILLLKPSRISRILITAVLFLCILETYTKFDKSYAYLGLCLYITVIAMNFASNFFIMYHSSPNEYILVVRQYFESVFEMFEIFKNRLDVIRQKCKWDVKFLPDLNIESEYPKYELNYARLFYSTFDLYDVHGITAGFIIFLMCQYLKYETFALLEIFTLCLLFAIAIAKDVKCFRLRKKLKETTKHMKDVTIDFLIWFENDCEMCKILHKYDTNNCTVDLFPFRSLKICRKPKHLNCAVSIIACEVFSGLDASRNYLKNALLFLAYGKNFTLEKLTVKTINPQMNEQLSEEYTLKKSCQVTGSCALPQDTDNSIKLPKYQQLEAMGRSGTRKDDTKPIMQEKKSDDHFIINNSEHVIKKSSFEPENTAKTASFSSSETKSDVLLKNKSAAKSFDENLPLRYELQRNEAEEKMEFSSGKFDFDLQEKSERIIYCDKSENSGLCHSCSESYVNKILLCKSCSHDFDLNSTPSIIFIKGLDQTSADLRKNVKKNLTKENKISFNKEELLETKSKDIRPDVHSNDTSKNATSGINKIFSTNDDACSCESIHCSSAVQCINIDESVENDFIKLDDSKSHQRKATEAKPSNECEVIDKDAIFDGKNNTPIKITNKSFTTNAEQHNCESMSIYALEERKTYADHNEMPESKFNEVCKSKEQDQTSNSFNKSDETFISNPTHEFEDDSSNLTNESRLGSSSIETFESTPSEIIESDIHKQKENTFATESSDTHILYDTYSCKTLNDKLMDNAENCSSNKNFEKEFNQVADSDLGELRTNETKFDIESRDIHTEKNSEYKNKDFEKRQDDEIDNKNISHKEVISPKKNSGKKCNRKKRHFNRSQKKKHFNVKNKETIKNFTEYSTNATEHFSNLEEAFREKSNDLEKKELISSDLENLNLESEISPVTDWINLSSHIIKYMETDTNKTETSKNKFNENETLDLHEQTVDEIKPTSEFEMNGKICILNSINTNPNLNVDKNVLDYDRYNSEMDDMHLKEECETYINELVEDIFNETSRSPTYPQSENRTQSNNGPNITTHIPLDDDSNNSSKLIEPSSSFIQDIKNINLKTDTSDITKSSNEDLNDSLDKNNETYEGESIRGKSENISNENKILDSNQKLTEKNPLDFDINSEITSNNKDSINQTSEINVNPDFKVTSKILEEIEEEEEEKQPVEENVPNFGLYLRNKQNISSELLSVINTTNSHQTYNENVLKLQNHYSGNENKSNTNTGDFTTSISCTNTSFPSAVKENFLPENANLENQQNDELDKGISPKIVISPKKISRKKCNRKKRHIKVSQKKKHFTIKNTEIIKNFPGDSVDATEHFSEPEEAFRKESHDLAKKELISSDLENMNLESEVSKITTAIAREKFEQQNLDVSNKIEREENASQLTSIPEIFGDSNTTVIEETTPNIYPNSFGNNKVFGKKPNNSLIQENYSFGDKKDVEAYSALLQESILAEDDKDVLMQCENLKQTDNKIAIARNDNSILETPLYDDTSLWDNDKYKVFMSEMVHAKKDANNPENAGTILHIDCIVALNESDKGISSESKFADNAQICLEKTQRRTLKGKRSLNNFKNQGQIYDINKESTNTNISNTNINTDAKNSFSIVSNNAPSLNERKVHLAEQSPLKTGETESEISGSEKNSRQDISEEGFRSRCSSKMTDEIIQNDKNEPATNISDISDAFLCKENKTPEKSAVKSEIEYIQHSQQTKIKSLTSDIINSEVQISKCNELTHPRNTLIRLWKDENNKISEIFPKYRNAVKRKIIHMEKELRTHIQSGVPKLPIIDVKENECFLQTEHGDKYFNSKLEVSCKYPDAEYEEHNEKKIQSWVMSVPPANSDENFPLLENSSISLELSTNNSKFLYNKSSNYNSNANHEGNSEDSLNRYQDIFPYSSHESFGQKNEISDESLNNSRTPLTGSSEDPNFHFHRSTSPSNRSSEASNESEDIFRKYKNSICVSTNSKSLELDEDKNNSLLKTDKSPDILCAKSAKTLGGVKWVSEIIPKDESRKIDNQSLNCTNNAEELEETSNTTKNLKNSKNTVKSLNEKLDKDYESDVISSESEHISNAHINLSSSKKYTNKQIVLSDAQMKLKDFVTFPDNYNQNHFQKTDPLKYHLKYKNLDLQVLDYSPSVTIRLIDEKDDSSPTLTPTWRQRCIDGSLSSSNSSINELELKTTASSYSNGETFKEDINIAKGKLKMTVRKSGFEDSALLSEAHKSIRNENTSSESTSRKIYDSKSDDTLMFPQKGTESTDEIEENKDKENHTILSELYKNENSTREHITNKYLATDNLGPIDTSARKTEILANSSLNQDDKFDEQYFLGSEISETDESNVCIPTGQCTKKENFLIGTETLVKENEYTKNFEFEAKGVKLTCKPDSESDSVEVKFRQIEDKTKLTFKSGSKKLYVKMSS